MRQVVRKIEPSRGTLLEDRVWPVATALLVLGGTVLCVILATLQFDDPRLGLRGAFWSQLTVAITLLAIIAAIVAPPGWVRRGVLLSLTLSLLFNLTLLLILSGMEIVSPVWKPPAVAEQPEQQLPQPTVPEYFPLAVEGHDRPRQEIQKPVPSGQPDMQQEQWLSRTTQPLQTTRPPVPDASAEVPIPRPPLPRPQQQVVESAPREFDLQGQISRQQRKDRPRVSQPLVDSSAVAQQPVPVQLAAPPADLQRQTTQPAETQLDLEPSPSSERPRLAEAPPRHRQTASPDPSLDSQPALPRRIENRGSPPHADVALADRPAIARQSDPQAAIVASTLSPQRESTTSQSMSFEALPGVESQVPPTRPRMMRQQPAAVAPQMAESNQPPPTIRQTTEATPSAVTRLAPLSSAVQAPELADAAPVVPESRPQTQRFEPAAKLPSPSADPTLQIAQLVRPESDETGQLTAVDPIPENVLTPAQRRTASAVPPVPPSVSATGRATPGAQPSPEVRLTPSRTALTRAEQGLAGGQTSVNLDRGREAPPSPVSIASASAQRAEATQDQRSGPSIAPSPGARIPRARSGASQPATTLRAAELPVAERMAAPMLAPAEVDAAAGGQRRLATAQQSEQTAQPGQSEVDLGPTRIASSDGRRAEAGGGQPVVVQARPESPVSASRTGGSLSAMLPATEVSAPVGTTTVAASEGGAQAATAQPQRVPAGDLASSATTADAVGSSVAEPLPRPRAGDPRFERLSPLETPLAQVVQPGGGTLQRLQQASSAPSVPARVIAESVQVPSRSVSRGQLDASPWAEQDIRRSVLGTGVPGQQPREAIGATMDQQLADGTEGPRPAVRVGPQRADSTVDPELTMGEQLETGSLAPLSRVTRRPAGAVASVRVPTPAAGTLSSIRSDPLQPDVAIAPRIGSIAESAAGALEVALDAPDDLGGLDRIPTPDVGVVNRRTQPESEYVVDRGTRFIRRDLGGPPSLDTQVVIPADAFLSRFSRKGQEPVGGDGRPSPKTEEAIELGLVYLSRQQAADGHWSLNRSGAEEAGQPAETVLIQSDTAATGLALLSFLGAGYHHYDDQYKDVVRLGLQFLIDQQKSDGDLYLAQDGLSNQSAWLYSHGIAAIALCEAYGMTQDPQLREPAQKAVDFIVASQHASRGGWRYTPAVGSDTSVSGWMVMALRSAELASLEVPQSVWDGVQHWLEMAQASPRRSELYRYNPMAPNTPTQGHGLRPSNTMTSVGLLMRMYTGWRRDNPQLIRGAEHLRQNLPEIGSTGDARRDTYYWYYATQVMFHMRGAYWDDWNERLHSLLVSSQEQAGPLAGSWDPQRPVRDRWAAHGGRLYVTTLNLLSLEVYYRHLPIYEDTAR